MIVSEKRINANRSNGIKSTGPRTEEGKKSSRANALKHGLCASVVVVEDAGLVQCRADTIFKALKPQNHFHCWLVQDIAVACVRTDRMRRTERRARDKICLRAELTWDDDRKHEAELVARGLSRDPAAVVSRLKKTPQGCEWLMSQWALLAHAATVKDAWSESQIKLAFDLQGTPAAFRDGHKPGVVLDFEGNVIDAGDDLAAVARREVALLKEHRAIVAEIDEAERHLAASDLASEYDPEVRLIRRYERELHRKIQAWIKQIQTPSPYKIADPTTSREWYTGQPFPEDEPLPGEKIPNDEHILEGTPPTPPQTAEEVAAEAWDPKEIHPPFDLEPHEYPAIGQDADIKAIAKNRKARRRAMAERRLEAKRKKVDQLGA